ncbi:MAG TPA: hypothetical protein VK933_08805 [Longimicrobiales bacterium]|nr:hypothetical protein [Longimicrobiales bacterium]
MSRPSLRWPVGALLPVVLLAGCGGRPGAAEGDDFLERNATTPAACSGR